MINNMLVKIFLFLITLLLELNLKTYRLRKCRKL